MPPIDKSKLDAMLSEVPEEDRDDFLKDFKRRGFTIGQNRQPPQIEDTKSMLMNALSSSVKEDIPYVGKAVGAMRDAPENIAEGLGRRGVPSTISAIAGEAALPIEAAGYLLPKTGGEFGLSLLSIPVGAAAGTALSKLVSPFASKMGQAAKSILQIAEEKGLSLTPADITNSRILSGLESFLEKTPLGSEVMNEFRDKQIASLTRSRDALVSKFGPSLEASVAGTKLTELIKESSKIAKAKSDALYSNLRSIIPEGATMPFDNLVETAKTLASKEKELPPAFRKSAGYRKLRSILNYSTIEPKNTGLLNAVGEEIKTAASKRNIPVNALLELRSTIGQDIVDTDAAIKAGAAGLKGLSTKEAGIYKQLYGAVERDLNQYAKTQNPDFRNTFDLARGSYKGFKATFDNKVIQRLIKTNPERILDGLIRPGNVTEIKSIRAAAGQQGIDIIKQKLAEKIFGEAAGDISPTAFIRGLRKYGDETLKTLFTPKELTDFKNLGELGARLKTAEKLAGNPSGTGRTVIYATNIGLAVASPAKGVAMFLGPYPAAKLYTSEIGRKYLTEGLKLSAKSKEGIKLASQISAYLSSRALTDKDNTEDR